MREVRVESLEGSERRGGQVRLSVNAGSLEVIFPEAVWEGALARTPVSEEPTAAELAELGEIQARLEDYARARSFKTVRRDVRCGVDRSALCYDLVLEPAGLLAVTTGYLFVPTVGRDLAERVAGALAAGGPVEQAYVLGAVADAAALSGGGGDLGVLSVRGRRSDASRFEIPPELWQVLSRGLGWRDVDTHAGTTRGDSPCRS